MIKFPIYPTVVFISWVAMLCINIYAEDEPKPLQLPARFDYSVLEFFQKIDDGLDLTYASREIREALNTMIAEKSATLSPSELSEVWSVIAATLAKDKLEKKDVILLLEWAQLPLSTPHPEVLERLMENGEKLLEIELILAMRHWQGSPQHATLTTLLQAKKPPAPPVPAGISIIVAAELQAVREIVAAASYGNGKVRDIMKWLAKPESAQFPEIFSEFIDKVKKSYYEDIINILRKEHWRASGVAPVIVSKVVADGKYYDDYIHEWAAKKILKDARFVNSPQIILMIAKVGESTSELSDILELPHWRNHPVLRFIAGNQTPTRSKLKRGLRGIRLKDLKEGLPVQLTDRFPAELANLSWLNPQAHPPIDQIMAQQNPSNSGSTVIPVTSMIPPEETTIETIRELISKPRYSGRETRSTIRWLETPQSSQYPDLFLEFITKVSKSNYEKIIKAALKKTHWLESPQIAEIVAYVITKAKYEDDYSHEKMAKKVLPSAVFVDYPELILMIVKGGEGDYELDDDTLTKEHWKRHPQLREWSRGRRPSNSRLNRVARQKRMKDWQEIVVNRCRTLNNRATTSGTL